MQRKIIIQVRSFGRVSFCLKSLRTSSNDLQSGICKLYDISH